MSSLAKVMAWCLMTPSHYLCQCWPIATGILWHWISQQVLTIPMTKIVLNNPLLKVQPHIPGDKELIVIVFFLYNTGMTRTCDHRHGLSCCNLSRVSLIWWSMENIIAFYIFFSLFVRRFPKSKSSIQENNNEGRFTIICSECDFCYQVTGLMSISTS